ncbi:MAG: 4-alpha-glucanotransferase [Verrucomicrobia bacterium]|nr:4-alpha-glucanotransferase [Verrucomicrobiota bacterium]
MNDRTESLHQLARWYGVETSYVDMARRRKFATPDTLVAVLRALGVDLDRPSDAATVLRQARWQRAQRPLDTVLVVWQGQPAHCQLQLPASQTEAAAQLTWQLESGESHRQNLALKRCRTLRRWRLENESFVTKRLPLPTHLPAGYHRITVETGSLSAQGWVVVAPETCFEPPRAPRTWGVFAPLYALHSKTSRGAGDFGDLQRLAGWVGAQGGELLGTLPLLPAFLDEPCECSPYSPVSRLFWNEFYLELEAIPEYRTNRAAQRLLESPTFRLRSQQLQADTLVHYREQMALKRRVLEVLVRDLFARPSRRRAALERFARQHPQAADYARFRAAGERHGVQWRHWPRRLEAGELRLGDYSQAAYRYHLYVQWLAREQMAALACRTRARGVDLYLDMPLGVHRDGYDVWRYRDLFALGASGGAPPDPVYTQGQDWGFAPLHPERCREDSYRYQAAYLRHHLERARFLRLDHAMGLHRLYWVPQGLPANRGAYVRYPADELYAVLSLESHRHQAIIIGENLGTVPPEVNAQLARHRVQEMFVAQYEFRPPPRPALRTVPARSLASLNTHDMPPFHAWWQALDLEDRLALGLIRPNQIPRERRLRHQCRQNLLRFLARKGHLESPRAEVDEVLRALLEQLSASPARWLLVNLEDLWLETLPQNVPGTSTERVNWRRKLRLTLDALPTHPAARALLGQVHRLRRGPVRS